MSFLKKIWRTFRAGGRTAKTAGTKTGKVAVTGAKKGGKVAVTGAKKGGKVAVTGAKKVGGAIAKPIKEGMAEEAPTEEPTE
ncbi:MAG: hypothetical protein ACE5OZ_08260 [Candidatus Heimdallarchaeota archaeon]